MFASARGVALRAVIVLSACAALGIFPAPPASAQPSLDWTRCVNKDKAVSADLAIAACTAVIRQGRGSSRALAGAFYYRARARQDNRDWARSIADLNEAIRLDPADGWAFKYRALAHYALHDCDRAISDETAALARQTAVSETLQWRGRSYLCKEDYDRAIADFTASLRLDPDKNPALGARGNAYFMAGRYGPAAEDLASVLHEYPTAAYVALWLHLAQLHAGRPDAVAALEANASNLKKEKWPYPAVELFLGRGRPDSILMLDNMRPVQLCDARFFIGEWHLMRGETQIASRVFASPEFSCADPTNDEYLGARAELRRLAP